MHGIPIMEYLKKVYAHEIELFKYQRDVLQLDNYNMFSNQLFDELFDLTHQPGAHKNIKIKKDKCGCCVVL